MYRLVGCGVRSIILSLGEIGRAVFAAGHIVVQCMAGPQMMVDYQMTIGHARYHRHLVAHKQYRGAPGKLLDYGVYAVLELLVDIRERFVEHQHLGVGNHGAGQERALQLTTRQLPHGLLQIPSDAA